MTAVSLIDVQINAIHRELVRRERMTVRQQLDHGCWHRGWQRHQDLRAREHALYLRRDAERRRVIVVANIQYDEEQRRLKRRQRAEIRTSKKVCPTCGAISYPVAA